MRKALRTAAVLTITLLVAGTAALAAPNEAIKRNNFGAELVKQGRLDEALTEFQSAVQSDAQYTAAHANLAYTYDRLGRVDEAIAAYKNVVALDPKNAVAFNNLGVLYVKRESYDEAIQAFQQGLKADPSNALLQQNLASVKKNRDILKEREVRIADAHPHHLDGELVPGVRGAQGGSERKRASVTPRVGPEPAAVA